MVTVNLTVADLTQRKPEQRESIRLPGLARRLQAPPSAVVPDDGDNFTQSQFYSTGSYQTGDLSGIRFGLNLCLAGTSPERT